MIEYSEQESKIFGVDFGRLILPAGFTHWNLLHEEISGCKFRYIRVRIQNPRAEELEQLSKLAPRAHLLEILRLYSSPDLLVTPFENEHADLRFELVNKQTMPLLEKLLYETYDDIPFGNYTPSMVTKVIPGPMQLKGIVEYFKARYAGSDPDKVAYIAYDSNGTPLGCSISDFFDRGTYSYYVGVARNERHRGIQYKIVNHIKFYTTARNKSFLCGATRLTNLYSARTMEKTGCKCTGYDWVYLLEL